MTQSREIEREFDLVLYGATGFVGGLTAGYLAGAASGVRIGLAGRSPARLQDVRTRLGDGAASWALIEADATAPQSLAAMAARTRVVVSTVGPYLRYGLPLVAACAAAGTDYADLTGETPFVRASIDRFHKPALDAGARIVHACGFDSIPSDLAVFALAQAVGSDGAGELGDTTLVVRALAGGMPAGTIASGIEMMRAVSADPGLRRRLADPYALSPDRGAEPELGPQPDYEIRRGAAIAPELSGRWTGGFVMAPFNTRIVRRSNALQAWAYGRRFRYREALSVGSAPVAPIAAAMATGTQLVTFGLGNRLMEYLPHSLVERFAPAPGTGPSERARKRGHYTVETYTTTTSGARYRTRVSQQGDPACTATSVLLGESALALACDRAGLSDLRGVLTPAAAMGALLLRRLPAAGVCVETLQVG